MKRASPIVGGLLALLASVPATAASVDREPAPLPDLIEDTTCGYLIEVTFPVNDEYSVAFYDNDGNLVRIHISGHLVVTLTNPANGASVTANISGPTTIDAETGAVTATGVAAGPLPGLSGLLVFSGRTTAESTHGHVHLDVCAALA